MTPSRGQGAGQRIRLVGTSDPYTSLQPGELGTVSFVDAAGTLHVSWDSGSSLGLIPGEDSWEYVAQPERTTP